MTVVGAGGIGCALAVALRNAGRTVRVVEANPAKVAAAQTDGIQIVGRPACRIHVTPFAEWTPTPGDTVLLAVKCYDNAAVLAKLPTDARVVPVQNGFDAALDARPHECEGIASFVSECDRNRPVARITRPGDLHLGPRGGPVPDWLGDLADALAAGGLFRVVRVSAVAPYKYAKLMYNAAISPLATAAGVDNGALLTLPVARRLFFALLRENYAILHGAGVALATIGPFHPRTVDRILARPWLSRLLARAFAPGLRGTYCSMAGEIQTGRTELANYNGHLLAIAGATPAPLNRRVVELVAGMTAVRAMPSPERLAALDGDDVVERGQDVA